jgi:hypothetical protein
MTPEFIKLMKDLVTCLLGRENLVPKKVGGQTVTARNLLEYFQAYMELFQNGKIPEVKSMFQVWSANV